MEQSESILVDLLKSLEEIDDILMKEEVNMAVNAAIKKTNECIIKLKEEIAKKE